jgi:nucleolar pre-ribosomal-associated protein 1
LLRIAASSSANSSIIPLKAALKAVIVENGVLSNTSQAFDALVASLHPSKKWSPSLSTYSFVDNCIGRVVRQPVHYLDLSILTLGKDTGSTSSGPLLACTAEQWPFLIKCDDLDAQQNVAEWIARFFSALGVGETDTTQSKIDEILDKMINAAQGTSGSALKKAFKKQSKHPIKLEPPEVFEAGQTKVEHKTKDVQELPPEIVLENIFGMPASNPDSIQGLDRWDNADLESAVTGGRLSRLLQCVASTEEEVRRQAFLVLRQLMAIVKV